MTLFITGTGTGVGKTLLTILLTRYLRKQGVRALAMKPFCSGAWDDTLLLMEANGGELTREEVTPEFCQRPLAPRAALAEGESIKAIERAVRSIKKNQDRCDLLIVEGVGGSGVPLAPRYTVASMIHEINARPLIVTVNKLGVLSDLTVNHEYLMRQTGRSSEVVLMTSKQVDEASQSNPEIIKEVLGHSRLAHMSYLGDNASKHGDWQKGEKKVRKTLAQIGAWYTVLPR